jgi:hypothetical protein
MMRIEFLRWWMKSRKTGDSLLRFLKNYELLLHHAFFIYLIYSISVVKDIT